MKKLLAAVLMVLAAGLIWWGSRQDQRPRPDARQEQPDRAYDFEAQDAVVRQMDAQGRLQFEVEARRIVQLPEGGGLLASDISLYHDPRGTLAGGPHRWKLQAREGRLPADGRVVSLQGAVVAEGMPAGARNRIHVSTEALDFDMDRQEITVDGELEFTSGSHSGRGRGLRVNVETGVMKLQSGRAKITL